MEDERLDKAINTVARRVLRNTINGYVADQREIWPELGEDDWGAVVAKVCDFADSLDDATMPEFTAAYGFLEQRAGGQ